MQSSRSSEAPPRPVFRIVLVVLAARWVQAESSYSGAAVGLGLSLVLLLFAIGTRRQRWLGPASHALLFFAVLAALISPEVQRTAQTAVSNGTVLQAGGVETASLVEPSTCAPGERVRITAGRARQHLARGPIPAPSGPSRERRLVLPDECIRVSLADSELVAARNKLQRKLQLARAKLIDQTHALRTGDTRALVQSLVFGETGALDFELADLFTRTGTRHLLAVSGLHVSLVLLLLIGPLSSLCVLALPSRIHARTRRVARDVIRLTALVALVYLAGARAPALRAASAFAFVQAGAHLPMRSARGRGSELGIMRKADTLSVWSLALLCECLAAGSESLSLSVQLSYGATFGLMLGTAPITRWLRRLMGLDMAIRNHAARGVWLRIPSRKLREFILTGSAASIAATSATLPVVWLQFGEWSPIGILATPLVLPLFTFVLFLSWSWIALQFDWIESLLNLSIEYLVSALELMDRAPCTPLLLPVRPSWWLAAWSLPFLFALLPQLTAASRTAALRLSAIVLAFGVFPWSPEPRTAELHVLDVGHGTAACLRIPGEPCWVFDAGSRDRSRVARNALLPLLATWEVSEVRVAVSHSDRDHCSALRTLATRLPVDLWVGASPEDCSVRLPHEVPRLDLGIGTLALPTAPASGLELELFRGQESHDNEGSRSLLIRFGETRVLLSGDAEGEALRRLAARLAEEPALTLLLLPHHGSDGPNFGRVLTQTRPAEVWISHSRTLTTAGELDRRGIPWRSTARDGSLAFELEREFAQPQMPDHD